MGAGADDMKGRAKEAIGDLTDDKDMKREGEKDRMGAKVKDMGDKLHDKVDEVVDKAKR